MPIFLWIILLGIPSLSILWWLWADRRFKAYQSHWLWRCTLACGMLSLLGSFIVVVAKRRGFIAWDLPEFLHAAVLLWGLILLPCLGVIMMVTWLLWSGALIALKKVFPTDESNIAINARRNFLKTIGVGLPLWLTFGATAVSAWQLRHFRVREITLLNKQLPPALDGLRIVHISDTHVGKFTNGDLLNEIADVTNRLKPDLIFVTGDLIDFSISDIHDAVGMLKRMRSTYGLFACEGNHDLFDDPAAFHQHLTNAKIPILRNACAQLTIRGCQLSIMGIAWHRQEEDIAESVKVTCNLADPNSYQILLAHHPHAYNTATNHGVHLTLAGHTHGGQLMLSEKVGPGPMMYQYWSGIYQKNSNHLVVSNGVGNWFPIRTHAPAEIVAITLKSHEANA